MLKCLRLLLLPLNLIYALVILVRNKCYDWGIFKSASFDLPIICIGNLAVGGVGKTPTTEYLVRLLANYKIAILSRGYGRKTKGFILADETATAEIIGDEPLQYYRKFKQVSVAVCEDRVAGINKLKGQHDIILLDDAYQHRKVKAGFNILLFELAKLQSIQLLLPAGNLREPMCGIKRAQAVLITKAPQTLSTQTRTNVVEKVAVDRSKGPFFSYINYGTLNHLFTGQTLVLRQNQPVFLLTGIANPEPLKSHLKQIGVQLTTFEYPDHHRFTCLLPLNFMRMISAVLIKKY
jgi:tetraacyldisaccharide 4'-kinase